MVYSVDLYVAQMLEMELLHQQKGHLDLEHGTLTKGDTGYPSICG